MQQNGPGEGINRRGREKLSDHVDAHRGLDEHILSFLIQNSIRPSIEAEWSSFAASSIQKRAEDHCPVCGSLPSLNLLKGPGGKRYSLCSYCGMNGESIGVLCRLRTRSSNFYRFCGEGEESYRIDLCDKCHHYIKTIDYKLLNHPILLGRSGDPPPRCSRRPNGVSESVPSYWSS